jgi:hypothetical protein
MLPSSSPPAYRWQLQDLRLEVLEALLDLECGEKVERNFSAVRGVQLAAIEDAARTILTRLS